MSEAQSPIEKKEIKFDYNDLIPFEHIMIGSSDKYDINGKLVNVTDSNISELVMDPDARKVVLSPISYKGGKRSLDDVREARLKKEAIYAMCFFESKTWVKYGLKHVDAAFKPGELDQNGQLKEFGIFFLQNNKKIDLPKSILTELPLNKCFKDVLEYVGSENNEMKFKIKDLKHN